MEMKSYTIKQYIDAGCPEMQDLTMLAVHGATSGKVCDAAGCWAFENGGCPAYKKLTKVYKEVKSPKHKTTNSDFAKNDQKFIKCCELAGVKPTARQASKFRNGKGVAFSKRNKWETSGLI